MMRGWRIPLWLKAPFVVAFAGLAGMCTAETITPARLTQILKDAKGGEMIVLPPGDYGSVVFPQRTYSPALRIDARQARFAGLVLRRVGGVEINGGTVASPRQQQFSVAVDFSHDIKLTGMAISGGRIAVAISRSHDIAVLGNDFAGTRSDGVNVAMTQRVRIENNSCRDFDPILAVYAADGKLIRDGDHPDCVQTWSALGYAPTSDLTVIGNTATGFMQGIWMSNPPGAEDIPFDRVIVKDNVLNLAAFNGIVVKNARNSDISGNTVNSVAGSRLQAFPYPPIKAWIRITGSGNRVCGNIVGADRSGEGTKHCPKK